VASGKKQGVRRAGGPAASATERSTGPPHRLRGRAIDDAVDDRMRARRLTLAVATALIVAGLALSALRVHQLERGELELGSSPTPPVRRA
jgi:hypothetical protein